MIPKQAHASVTTLTSYKCREFDVGGSNGIGSNSKCALASPLLGIAVINLWV